MIKKIRNTDDIKSSVKKLYYQSVYTQVEIPEFLLERRNKLFTGRREELHWIPEILNEYHLVIISAPPGYEQIALHLNMLTCENLRMKM